MAVEWFKICVKVHLIVLRINKSVQPSTIVDICISELNHDVVDGVP